MPYHETESHKRARAIAQMMDRLPGIREMSRPCWIDDYHPMSERQHFYNKMERLSWPTCKWQEDFEKLVSQAYSTGTGVYKHKGRRLLKPKIYQERDVYFSLEINQPIRRNIARIIMS